MQKRGFIRVVKFRNTVLGIAITCTVLFSIAWVITLESSRKEFTLENFYKKKQNVLLLIVDDLRPALGCYGDKNAITPNIDFLAARGIIFANAHAQQALCAPSRTSFLTSRRPDTLHLYHVGAYWRHAVGNFTTLPQHFKNNGYFTYGIGKVFHPGKVSGYDDKDFSWSKPPFHPSTEKYKNAPVCFKDGRNMTNIVCPVNVTDQPEKTLPDMEIAEEALRFLNDNATNGKPFFLAVGFQKPHIPLKMPAHYMDLFPDMGLAPNPTKPERMPNISWNPWEDLRIREDVKELNVSFPFGPLPEDYQKQVRQAYYAATTYIDDLIGQVLEALENNSLAENTIIALIGDHGWSLGEHQEWSKYSNFHVATNVPFILYVPRVTEVLDAHRPPFKHINPFNNTDYELPFYKLCMPGMPDARFQKADCVVAHSQLRSHELVELVDLFPTLADVAKLGVPLPSCPTTSRHVDLCTEGRSLKPLVDYYRTEGMKEAYAGWANRSYSQYPRPSIYPQNNTDQPHLKDINYMGYSLLTGHLHFIAWVEFDHVTFRPVWDNIVAFELYNRLSDPLENNNIFDEGDEQEKQRLLNMLMDAFNS